VKLLYRLGEQDQFDIDDYKKKVHDKGATVLLVKTGVDWIAGGYTSVPWKNDPNHKTVSDEKAFLFSVQHRKKYPILKKENAVRHTNNWGPIFGYPGWGLIIGWDKKRYPQSIFEGSGYGNSEYGVPALNGKSALTGEGSTYTLKEAEIFLIEN